MRLGSSNSVVLAIGIKVTNHSEQLECGVSGGKGNTCMTEKKRNDKIYYSVIVTTATKPVG